MSRKREPIVDLLNYFEMATLEVAEQALTLAKRIVLAKRHRSGMPVGEAKPLGSRKPKQKPEESVGP